MTEKRPYKKRTKAQGKNQVRFNLNIDKDVYEALQEKLGPYGWTRYINEAIKKRLRRK